MTDKLREAHDMGFAAFHDGGSKEENEFEYGSDQWNAWNQGFEEAVAQES